MALSQILVDTWVNHLQFLEPRPTENGLVDGVFYGVLSVAGDMSGGAVTQIGQFSVNRKEDWVYIMQGVSTERNSATNSDVGISVATGPLIPTVTAVNNAVFSRAGSSDGVSGLGTLPLSAGQPPWKGMPCFGDKNIPGLFSILTAVWGTNSNTILYTTSMWGYLVRYQNFFRLQSLRDLPFRGVR